MVQDRFQDVAARARRNAGAPIGVAAASPVKLDRLIDRLSGELTPVAEAEPRRQLMVATGLGIVVASLCMAIARGVRTDMFQPEAASALVIKWLYALGLGGLALWAAGHLARPDGDDRAQRAWLVLPVACLAATAAAQLAVAAPGLRVAMMMGHTGLVCPLWILGASLPALAGLIFVMRRQAPTRPVRTGALLGLAAGAAGAAAYAIFCRETTLPFIAVWYTLGMAAAASLGAIVGARFLRW
jgi:hypothetical protein